MVVMEMTPFTYHQAVTLSDTVDNIKNGLYIQNVGAAGVVMIRQTAAYGNVTVGLAQYQAIMIGKHWLGAMLTGTTTGDLRIFR